MFHVLLVAPLLGLLAAYGIVVLIVLSVPFCLGGFFQLVLTIAAGDRWAVWVPAGLGVLGLALSFLFLLGAIPWGGILLYWALYFLWIWLIWLVVAQIKKSVGRWREKQERGPPLTRINGVSFDRRGLFRQCRTCFWRRKKVRGAYVSAPGPVGGSATSGDFGHL